MTIRLHRGDLPDLSRYGEMVAVDTETTSLTPSTTTLVGLSLAVVPGRGHRPSPCPRPWAMRKPCGS